MYLKGGFETLEYKGVLVANFRSGSDITAQIFDFLPGIFDVVFGKKNDNFSNISGLKRKLKKTALQRHAVRKVISLSEFLK